MQDPVLGYGLEEYRSLFKDAKLIFFCPAKSGGIEIASNGNIYPCPFLYNKDFLLGNIYDTDFRTIQKSNPIARRDLSKTRCKICTNYPYCEGGCAARTYATYKNINFSEPNCSHS